MTIVCAFSEEGREGGESSRDIDTIFDPASEFFTSMYTLMITIPQTVCMFITGWHRFETKLRFV